MNRYSDSGFIKLLGDVIMDKAQFIAKINENLMTDGRTDIKNASVK